MSRAKDLARDSLNEARRSVWDLAPRALDAQPLAGAIEEEVRCFAADGSERASFAVSGAPGTLPPPTEAALLRICQEALANVRRHARASEVSVELEFTADAIHLRIGDNGAGFGVSDAQEAARARGGGFGISGMQQRARLLSGSLTVRRNGGRCTLVEAIIPTAADAVAAR